MGVVRDACVPGEKVRGLIGGQGGIRTRGGCYTTHAFQACALNHSATCPSAILRAVGRSYSAAGAGGNAVFPPCPGLARAVSGPLARKRADRCSWLHRANSVRLFPAGRNLL